jgi:hypothetical protein
VTLQDTIVRTKTLPTPISTRNLLLKLFSTRFPTWMRGQIQIRRRIRPLPTKANIPNILQRRKLHRLTSRTPPIKTLILLRNQINRRRRTSPFLDTIQVKNRETTRTRPNRRRPPNHIITNHTLNRTLQKLLLNFLRKLRQIRVLHFPSLHPPLLPPTHLTTSRCIHTTLIPIISYSSPMARMPTISIVSRAETRRWVWVWVWVYIPIQWKRRIRSSGNPRLSGRESGPATIIIISPVISGLEAHILWYQQQPPSSTTTACIHHHQINPNLLNFRSKRRN